MGKRRTKKQKIKAAKRAKQALIKKSEEKSVEIKWEEKKTVKDKVTVIKENSKNSLDKKAIIKDLRKTVWIALILGGVLALIFLKLKSGG